MNKIIGVIGPIASGKDFVAEYIGRKLNISCYQISLPLKEMAKSQGIPATRDNLIKLSKNLAAEKGDDYLAKLITSKTKAPFVIAGMRQLGQINFLRENFDMVLISINAPVELRFERTKETKKLGEATNLRDFIKREKKENSGKNPMRVFECMKLADYAIENNGTVNELYKKIDKILTKEGYIH